MDVYPTLEAVAEAAGAPPIEQWAERVLEHMDQSPWVRELCIARVPEQHGARLALLASEIANNALEHGRLPVQFRYARGTRGFAFGVHQREPFLTEEQVDALLTGRNGTQELERYLEDGRGAGGAVIRANASGLYVDRSRCAIYATVLF